MHPSTAALGSLSWGADELRRYHAGGGVMNDSVEELDIEEDIDYNDMGALDDDGLSVASFDAHAHDDGLGGMEVRTMQ
jgi:hypothetical protein